MLAKCSLIAAIVLLPRLVLAEPEQRPGPRPRVVEVGLLLGGFFPSSEQEFYDPAAATPEPLKSVNLELGARLGYYPVRALGIETEGFAAATRTDAAGRWAPLIGLRGHLVAQWPARVAPFVLAGGGIWYLSSRNNVLGSDADVLLHYGGGVKLYLTPRIVLRLELRAIRAPAANSDTGTNHFEGLLGVTLLPAAKSPRAAPEPDDDADGDGVRGDDDECPDRAGEPPDGCPAADDDRDDDGIVDQRDQCPDQAETKNEWEDDDGCPDQIPDSDGDGISDRDDRCRNLAEDEDGFEDHDGCPDLDNDGDGIADGKDNCPDQAGLIDRQGCPRPAPSQDYTPPSGPSELATIYFRIGQARIQSSMRRVARHAARYLRHHPEINKVRIEGHADETGSSERNRELSQQRADAVLRRLVDKGVSPDRLEAVGFGDEHPVGDNTTGTGRSANRRVDFRILED